MAKELPPANKTEVSESEVIDPHLRITFPLPSVPGWTDWDAESRAAYIDNLSTQLTYQNTEVFIPFSRTYSAADFDELVAPFELSSLKDDKSYFDKHPHYLTLYIKFDDQLFPHHNQNEWRVTIKIDGNIIGVYDNKLIAYQPSRHS